MSLLSKIVGTFTGANAKKKAADQMRAASEQEAKTLRELAQPGIETSVLGYSSLRNLVNTYMRSQLGQDSPILRAQHERNLSDLGSSERMARASSAHFFGATGNAALGRGEQFRIGLAADQRRSAENLNYASQQDQYRSAALQRYFGGVTSMLGAGQAGLNMAGQAANILGTGQRQAAEMRAQASMLNAAFGMNVLGTFLGAYTNIGNPSGGR